MNALNEIVKNLMAWILTGIIIVTLESRLTLGDAKKDVESINSNVKDIKTAVEYNSNKIREIELEQTKRLSEIEWVRKFREANGWSSGHGDYKVK